MEDKFKVLREAERYVLDQQYDKAVQQYRKLLDYQGDDPGLLNTLGDLLLKSGRVDEAIGYFRRAGEVFAQGGFVNKAIAVYKKVDSYRPGERETLRKLVDLNAKRGLKSETGRYLHQLAALQQASNDQRGALQSFRQLAEYRSADPSAHRNLAQMEESAGDSPSAVRHYVTASRLFLRGDLPDEAYHCAEEALKIDGDSSEAMELLLTAGGRRSELPARQAENSEKAVEPVEFAEEEADSTPLQVDLEEVETALAESPGEEESTLGEFFEEEETALEELSEEKPTVGEELEDAEFDFEALFETEQIPDSPGEALPEDSVTLEKGESESAKEFFSVEEMEEEETGPAAAEVKPEGEAVRAGLESVEEAAAEMPQVDDMLEEVDFYLKLDLREDAEGLLRKLTSDHGDHPGVRERALRLGLLEESAETLGEAGGPESSKVFDSEVETALEELFFEDAPAPRESEETAYAVSSDPASMGEDPQAQYDLGLAYREMGMFGDAAEKFELAYRLFLEQEQPERAQLCVSMLTSTYLGLEEYEEVVTWAEKGLQTESAQGFERKALEYDRAQALEKMGQLDESREGYRRILDEDPQFRDVEDRLARLS